MADPEAHGVAPGARRILTPGGDDECGGRMASRQQQRPERALRAWSGQDPVAKLGEERCAKAIETGAGRSSRTDLRAQRHVPGAHSRVHNSTLGFVQLSAENLRNSSFQGFVRQQRS